MVELSDEQFDALITRAMNELPQEYIKNMQNVAIVMADEPTEQQREQMKLDPERVLLLGLFEGVPKTLQGSGWSGMLPSKITLFKNQLLRAVHSPDEFYEQIKRTLWHEIAHYYGLTHADMDERQHGH